MGTLVAGPFLLLFVLAIIVPIGLWFAFAAAVLWGWFVVPVFNVPALSTWQMWGIILMLSVLRPKYSSIYKDQREVDWGKVGFLLLAPAISLGLGAGLKFWILP